MKEWGKRFLCAGVALLFAFGLARAARFKYQDAEQAFREDSRKQLAASGMTREAAKGKYPTPEIGMVTAPCLQPGATGELMARGKFPQGAKFILQNDNLEIVKETATATQYQATVKAAAGVGPQSASLVVISPLTGITANHPGAASIGGRFQWDLTASNGWKVTAAPTGSGCPGSSSSQDYEMAFYKPGQTAPFQKLSGTLSHDQWSAENFSFSVSEPNPMAAAGMGDMESLMRKMSDPKTSDAERDRIIAQITKMQDQLQAVVAKMADPANIAKMEADKAEFGCGHLWLSETGGAVKGRMQCSSKVGSLTVTGAMKYLGAK